MKKLTFMVFFASLVICSGMASFTTNESNAAGKTYKIGDKGPAGGLVFYDKGNDSDGWRYMEAAPKDQSARAEWGCFTKGIPDTKGIAIGTGKSNTDAIVKGCEDAKAAAKLCTEYRGGGKSDWFLPSQEELNLMYLNLYKKKMGNFDKGFYWSSSEYLDNGAWSQRFSDGYQNDGYMKDDKGRVRAVRAFK